MIDFTDYSQPARPVVHRYIATKVTKPRLRDHLNWFDLVLAFLVFAAFASSIFEGW